jgi:hypothetical protein
MFIMKHIFLFLVACSFMYAGFGQSKDKVNATPDPSQKIQSVEASCGKCKLGLKGTSCELAVRVAGHSYYVDGYNIDDFGDAHDDSGFCKAIRKAEVQGFVVNGRFKASYFKLLPVERKN